MALPDAWRLLIVQDSAQKGLSGDDEKRRIADLPLIATGARGRYLPSGPHAGAARRCHFRLRCFRCRHHAHPASSRRTLRARAGGPCLRERQVGRLLGWALQAGHVGGIGQSSWGPTGFAILASQVQAEAAIDAIQTAGLVAPSLSLRIVSGRNTGATLLDRRTEVPSLESNAEWSPWNAPTSSTCSRRDGR